MVSATEWTILRSLMILALEGGGPKKSVALVRLHKHLRVSEPAIRDDIAHLESIQLVDVEVEERSLLLSLRGEAGVLFDFYVKIAERDATNDDALCLREFDTQLN